MKVICAILLCLLQQTASASLSSSTRFPSAAIRRAPDRQSVLVRPDRHGPLSSIPTHSWAGYRLVRRPTTRDLPCVESRTDIVHLQRSLSPPIANKVRARRSDLVPPQRPADSAVLFIRCRARFGQNARHLPAIPQYLQPLPLLLFTLPLPMPGTVHNR